MIKNLRKKFTVVAMGSMFVVLAVIMMAFNLLNYVHLVDDADHMIQMIVENEGKFPSPLHEKAEPKKEPPKGEEERMSPETPYRTRYFSVRMEETGNVLSTDLQYIAAVSEKEAGQYAQEVWDGQKEKGFYHIYRYQCVQEDHGVMIVFLDCREELESFRTSLFMSIAVSAGGLLAVFVLVLFFSGIVFRPVADSYRKQKQFITDASHEIKTPLTIMEANVEVIEMEHGEDEWTKSIHKQIQRLAAFTRQLICILMDNAVKYSPEGSTIYVSLQKKGKKILFEVYNETEGIPMGNLDMLFERFYRLDASRNSETGGSGIGLSIARAIVESHHGRIRAKSDDGKSIRISVGFP